MIEIDVRLEGACISAACIDTNQVFRLIAILLSLFDNLLTLSRSEQRHSDTFRKVYCIDQRFVCFLEIDGQGR